MKNKNVSFIGHRFDWQNFGIEEKLFEEAEKLIINGSINFYMGNNGYFDFLAYKTMKSLKNKYPYIQVILVSHKLYIKKEEAPQGYDEIIYPDLENVHFKQSIIKRNEWLINNTDTLLCHVYETYKSGAYRVLKYAEKKGKIIINI